MSLTVLHVQVLTAAETLSDCQRKLLHKCFTITSMIQMCSNFHWQVLTAAETLDDALADGSEFLGESRQV